MKRVVPIVVTDELTNVVKVTKFRDNGPEAQGNMEHRGLRFVSVPSDDQLTRALDLITQEMVASGGTWPFPAEREAAARIRAAFQLDEVE